MDNKAETKQIIEISLKRTIFRAISMVLVIALVGGSILLLYKKANNTSLEEFVIKSGPIFVPILSPERPKGYPDELPTINNVILVEMEAQPGAVRVQLASPDKPSEVVSTVISSFVKSGWNTRFARSDSLLSGGASTPSGPEVVGIYVTPEPSSGSPKGWTTIIFLLQKEAESELKKPKKEKKPIDLQKLG